MAVISPLTRTSDHLNLVRAASAGAVFLGHARNIFFEDYSSISDPSAVCRAFYFLAGFGHQAVIIFFVLSGLLIAPAVTKDVRLGRWSWRIYSVNRLVRLQLVLIPCLLLTAFWD